MSLEVMSEHKEGDGDADDASQSRKRKTGTLTDNDVISTTPVDDATLARVVALCSETARVSASLDARDELDMLLMSVDPSSRASGDAHADETAVRELERDMAKGGKEGGNSDKEDDSDKEDEEDSSTHSASEYDPTEERESFVRLLAHRELIHDPEMQRALLLSVMTRRKGTRRLQSMEELRRFALQQERYLQDRVSRHVLDALLSPPSVDVQLAVSACTDTNIASIKKVLTTPRDDAAGFAVYELWFVHPDPRVSQPLAVVDPVLLPSKHTPERFMTFVTQFLNAWVVSESRCAVFPRLRPIAALPSKRRMDGSSSTQDVARVTANGIFFDSMEAFCKAVRVLHMPCPDPIEINNVAAFSYRWPFAPRDDRPFPKDTRRTVMASLKEVLTDEHVVERGDETRARLVSTTAGVGGSSTDAAVAMETVERWLDKEWNHAVARTDLRSHAFLSAIPSMALLVRFISLSMRVEPTRREPDLPAVVLHVESGMNDAADRRLQRWHEKSRVVFRCAICDVPCWMFWVPPMRHHVWYCGATWCKQLGPLSLQHEGVLKEVLRGNEVDTEFSEFQPCCELDPVVIEPYQDVEKFISNVYMASLRANSSDVLFDLLHGELSSRLPAREASFRINNLHLTPSVVGVATHAPRPRPRPDNPLAAALADAEARFNSPSLAEAVVPTPPVQQTLHAATAMPSFQPQPGVVTSPRVPMDLENTATQHASAALAAAQAVSGDAPLQGRMLDALTSDLSPSRLDNPSPPPRAVFSDFGPQDFVLPVERKTLERATDAVVKDHLQRRNELRDVYGAEVDAKWGAPGARRPAGLTLLLPSLVFGSFAAMQTAWRTARRGRILTEEDMRDTREFVILHRTEYVQRLKRLVDQLIDAAASSEPVAASHGTADEDEHVLWRLVAMRATSDLREWATLIFSDQRIIALNSLEGPADQSRRRHAISVLTACYEEIQKLATERWSRYRANYHLPGPRAQLLALWNGCAAGGLLTKEDELVRFLRGWTAASRHINAFYSGQLGDDELQTLRSTPLVAELSVDVPRDPFLALPRRAGVDVSNLRQWLVCLEQFRRACESSIVAHLSNDALADKDVPIPDQLVDFCATSVRRTENARRLVTAFSAAWRKSRRLWMEAWTAWSERTKGGGRDATRHAERKGGDGDEQDNNPLGWKRLQTLLASDARVWFTVPDADSRFLHTESHAPVATAAYPDSAAERAWIRAERLLSVNSHFSSHVPSRGVDLASSTSPADTELLDRYVRGVTTNLSHNEVSVAYAGRPELWRLATHTGQHRLVPVSDPEDRSGLDFYDLHAFDPDLVETIDDALALCRSIRKTQPSDQPMPSDLPYMAFHSIGFPALTNAHCRYVVAQAALALVAAYSGTGMVIPVPIRTSDGASGIETMKHAMYTCQPTVPFCARATTTLSPDEPMRERIAAIKNIARRICVHFLSGRELSPTNPKREEDLAIIRQGIVAYEQNARPVDSHRLFFFRDVGITTLSDARRVLCVGVSLLRADELWSFPLTAFTVSVEAQPHVRKLLLRHAACARLANRTHEISADDIARAAPGTTVKSLMETVLYRSVIIDGIAQQVVVVPLISEDPEELYHRAQRVSQTRIQAFIADARRDTTPFARHVGLLVQALGEEGMRAWYQTIGRDLVADLTLQFPIINRSIPDRKALIARLEEVAISTVAGENDTLSARTLLQTLPASIGNYNSMLRSVLVEVNVGDRIREQLGTVGIDATGPVAQLGLRSQRLMTLIRARWIPRLLLDLTAHSIAVQSTQFAVDAIRWAVGQSTHLHSRHDWHAPRDTVRLPWLQGLRMPFPTGFDHEPGSADHRSQDKDLRIATCHLFLKELYPSFWNEWARPAEDTATTLQHWLGKTYHVARSAAAAGSAAVEAYIPQTRAWTQYVRQYADAHAAASAPVVVPRVMYDDVVSLLFNRPILSDVSDDHGRAVVLARLDAQPVPWVPLRQEGAWDAFPPASPWARVDGVGGLPVDSVTHRRLRRGGAVDTDGLLEYIEDVCTPAVNLDDIDLFRTESNAVLKASVETRLRDLLTTAGPLRRPPNRLTDIDARCSLPFDVVRSVFAGPLSRGAGTYRFGSAELTDTTDETKEADASQLTAFLDAVVHRMAVFARDPDLFLQKPNEDFDVPWFDQRPRCDSVQVHVAVLQLQSLFGDDETPETATRLMQLMGTLSTERFDLGLDPEKGAVPIQVVSALRAAIQEEQRARPGCKVDDIWERIAVHARRLDAVPEYTRTQFNELLTAELPGCSRDDKKVIWGCAREISARRVAMHLSYVPEGNYVAGAVVCALRHFLTPDTVVWQRIWQSIGRETTVDYSIEDLLCDVAPVTVTVDSLMALIPDALRNRTAELGCGALLRELHRRSVQQYQRALEFTASRSPHATVAMAPFLLPWSDADSRLLWTVEEVVPPSAMDSAFHTNAARTTESCLGLLCAVFWRELEERLVAHGAVEGAVVYRSTDERLVRDRIDVIERTLDMTINDPLSVFRDVEADVVVGRLVDAALAMVAKNTNIRMPQVTLQPIREVLVQIRMALESTPRLFSNTARWNAAWKFARSALPNRGFERKDDPSTPMPAVAAAVDTAPSIFAETDVILTARDCVAALHAALMRGLGTPALVTAEWFSDFTVRALQFVMTAAKYTERAPIAHHRRVDEHLAEMEHTVTQRLDGIIRSLLNKGSTDSISAEPWRTRLEATQIEAYLKATMDRPVEDASQEEDTAFQRINVDLGAWNHVHSLLLNLHQIHRTEPDIKASHMQLLVLHTRRNRALYFDRAVRAAYRIYTSRAPGRPHQYLNALCRMYTYAVSRSNDRVVVDPATLAANAEACDFAARVSQVTDQLRQFVDRTGVSDAIGHGLRCITSDRIFQLLHGDQLPMYPDTTDDVTWREIRRVFRALEPNAAESESYTDVVPYASLFVDEHISPIVDLGKQFVASLRAHSNNPREHNPPFHPLHAIAYLSLVQFHDWWLPNEYKLRIINDETLCTPDGDTLRALADDEAMYPGNELDRLIGRATDAIRSQLDLANRNNLVFAPRTFLSKLTPTQLRCIFDYVALANEALVRLSRVEHAEANSIRFRIHIGKAISVYTALRVSFDEVLQFEGRLLGATVAARERAAIRTPTALMADAFRLLSGAEPTVDQSQRLAYALSLPSAQCLAELVQMSAADPTQMTATLTERIKELLARAAETRNRWIELLRNVSSHLDVVPPASANSTTNFQLAYNAAIESQSAYVSYVRKASVATQLAAKRAEATRIVKQTIQRWYLDMSKRTRTAAAASEAASAPVAAVAPAGAPDSAGQGPRAAASTEPPPAAVESKPTHVHTESLPPVPPRERVADVVTAPVINRPVAAPTVRPERPAAAAAAAAAASESAPVPAQQRDKSSKPGKPSKTTGNSFTGAQSSVYQRETVHTHRRLAVPVVAIRDQHEPDHTEPKRSRKLRILDPRW